jgi:hypothetical protein
MKTNDQRAEEAADNEHFSNHTHQSNHSATQGTAQPEEQPPSAPEADDPDNETLTSASAVIFGLPLTQIPTSDDYQEDEAPDDNLF